MKTRAGTPRIEQPTYGTGRPEIYYPGRPRVIKARPKIRKGRVAFHLTRGNPRRKNSVNDETRTWYGWRIGDVEEWETDFGTDGSWIPRNTALRVEAITMWGPHETNLLHIRQALDEAGHPEGVVLTRESVTVYGEAREVTGYRPGKPGAVIVDVDGTLCDVSGIRHYVTGKRRNFDKFHKASALCPPIPATLEWVADWVERGAAIIIVTARRREYEQLTRTWLHKWDVDCHELHMRANNDDRPDREVKRDILANIRERYEVIAAIDDNPNVIALWESEGIPTTVVPGWDKPELVKKVH